MLRRLAKQRGAMDMLGKTTPPCLPLRSSPAAAGCYPTLGLGTVHCREALQACALLGGRAQARLTLVQVLVIASHVPEQQSEPGNLGAGVAPLHGARRCARCAERALYLAGTAPLPPGRPAWLRLSAGV